MMCASVASPGLPWAGEVGGVQAGEAGADSVSRGALGACSLVPRGRLVSVAAGWGAGRSFGLSLMLPRFFPVTRAGRLLSRGRRGGAFGCGLAGVLELLAAASLDVVGLWFTLGLVSMSSNSS